MDPDFWHQRWQQSEIGFHQNEINPHLERFWNHLGAPPAARVFVPLCGKTRDMLWLRGRGHTVLGVELSPIAVADFYREQGLAAAVSEARGFLHFAADGIDILCGDFFQLEAAQLEGVAAVYDRASLVALPPAMRADYARHLRRLLPAGCPILLVTFDYDQAAMAGPPFAVTLAEIDALYDDAYRIEVIHRQDLLAGQERERWRARGLERMVEIVVLLTTK